MNEDTQYLFHVEGDTATEVVFSDIQFSDEVAPLYEGAAVTREIPIMVEGTYALLDRTTRKYRNVTITADDIRQYHTRTKRDVAINYEHVQRNPTKGWVRLKDTGRIGIMRTRDGNKTALFSRLELFNEGKTAVQSGLFRDVSIELKPASKEVTGLALTATPIMGDLQFFSMITDEPEPETEAASINTEPMPGLSVEGTLVVTPVVEQVDPVQPEPAELYSDPTPIPQEEPIVEPTVLTEEQKAANALEALQFFGLTPDDITAFKDQRAQANLVLAKDRIRTLAQRDGKQLLAPAGIDVAAQLLLFAQENDEQLFSVEGSESQVNAEALLTELFNHINAVQLFGESGDFSTEDLEVPDPAAEPTVDENRLARMTGLAKRAMNNFK